MTATPGNSLAATRRCHLHKVLGGRTSDAPAPSLQRSITSTPGEISRALVALIADLRGMGLPASAISDLQVVLAEVFNNIGEHAYGQGVPGRIRLELYLCDCSIVCRISDTGHGMPDRQIPTGLLPSSAVDLQDLPEGGFGWFLIRQLTCNLSYSRGEGANTLEFQVMLDG